jgi:hypothetical protein
MNLAPWRLTDDQKPSGVRQLYNGSGTERQFCLTDPTGPNFAQQTFQRHQGAFSNIYTVFRVRGRISQLVQMTYKTEHVDRFSCSKNLSSNQATAAAFGR